MVGCAVVPDKSSRGRTEGEDGRSLSFIGSASFEMVVVSCADGICGMCKSRSRAAGVKAAALASPWTFH